MRILSVTEPAPSAVVENTNLPGISLLAPGVPSTSAFIAAASVNPVPFAPTQVMLPKLSPLATIVFPPILPFLDLTK